MCISVQTNWKFDNCFRSEHYKTHNFSFIKLYENLCSPLFAQQNRCYCIYSCKTVNRIEFIYFVRVPARFWGNCCSCVGNLTRLVDSLKPHIFISWVTAVWISLFSSIFFGSCQSISTHMRISQSFQLILTDGEEDDANVAKVTIDFFQNTRTISVY